VFPGLNLSGGFALPGYYVPSVFERAAAPRQRRWTHSYAEHDCATRDDFERDGPGESTEPAEPASPEPAAAEADPDAPRDAEWPFLDALAVTCSGEVLYRGPETVVSRTAGLPTGAAQFARFGNSAFLFCVVATDTCEASAALMLALGKLAGCARIYAPVADLANAARLEQFGFRASDDDPHLFVRTIPTKSGDPTHAA
jgi:hypothetical protein